MKTMSDQDLFSRLRRLLGSGWIKIPDKPGYGGSGAPGKILEKQLGLDGGNKDTPDGGKWELKYHSDSSPITLFHLEAKPKGHMRHMVREFGWEDGKGRTSFRHTIWGRSDRGFYVKDESKRITVCNDSVSDMVWPFWTHQSLNNAFVAKLRRVIAVRGEKSEGRVRYLSACLYREPDAALFIGAISEGIIAIDFDARTGDGKGLRNHGTKFRVKAEHLEKLYSHVKKFS